MLVFIDESGDPGFKLDKGSSQVFVLSMVIFREAEEAQRAEALIRRLQSANHIKPEWKFAKVSNQARDNFFDGIAPISFACRALVIRKELIRSENLRSNPRRFYNFFTRLMCQHDGGVLKDARIVIDGSGDRAFKQELQTYMRRELPAGTIRKMGFKDSCKDSLVQLADMCAGAVARSYSENRSEAERWRNMLARSGQISDIWDFR
jgi:hypothetical protein